MGKEAGGWKIEHSGWHACGEHRRFWSPPSRRTGISNATRIWWSSTVPGSCPVGTSDNSPTFQRWVRVRNEGSVPKGRLNEHPVSAVLSGLTPSYGQPPNVETLGYCRTSLRDEDEILVALDKNVRAPPAVTDRLLRRGLWRG